MEDELGSSRIEVVIDKELLEEGEEDETRLEHSRGD